MKTWRYLLIAFALFASCGGDSSDPVTPNGVIECTSAADCSGDRVCRASTCTVAETSPRALGFRLVPPPMSTYPTQTVAIRELAADTPVQIGLNPGVRVAGDVSWINSEAGPGAGQLQFRRRGDSFTAEAQVQANEYAVYIPAGIYDITFFPANPQRPTHVWSEVKIELDTDPRLQLDSQEVRIVGTLARTDAVSRESDFVGRAKVFATANDSGITSSVGITDESGNFEIVVPKDSGFYNLHIAPAEPNTYSEEAPDADYVPEATFEAAFNVTGDDWVNLLDASGDSDVLGVSLGEYAYAPVTIPLTLAIDGESVADWTGTTVTLKTKAGKGVVSVRQRLGESGQFRLPLIAGIYEAVVRTPPALPARSMVLSDISVSAEGVTLNIERRANIQGMVEAPDGAPLADAEIRFVPTSDSLGEQLSVRSDADGRYEAWLDDEQYTLTVVPNDPGLPRQVLDVTDTTVPDTIRISDPVLVWGTVFGTPSESGSDSWSGVADVSVNVIETLDGVERMVGEGQTNESGEFKVFISAR